jgi:hypothetical protein
MWSNGDVSDHDPHDPEDGGEASPWTRDDWDPDSTAPPPGAFPGAGGPSTQAASSGGFGGLGEPPPEDFEQPDPADARSRSSLGRKVVAGAIVATLLIGSAGALLQGGDDPEPIPTTTTSPDRASDTTDAAGTAAPTAPPPTTETVTVTSPPSDGAVDGAAATTVPAPPFVVGVAPTWSEGVVDIPANLAGMAPTEVITLSQSGIVSVTEFPSGRSRSIDASALGEAAQLAVGDRTIVVFDATRLVQIRDGEPVVESTMNDGIIFVQPWTGTGSFVVTTPSTGPGAPEQDWVLRPDGSLLPLDNPFTDETSFFSRVFAASGEALFTAPGGVYAVGPDGAARRISTGALLATGTRHWAIEECDEALRCAHSIIDWDTGTVTAGVLDPLERFGIIDPSTHISPDGRSIVFRAPGSDGTGRRQILDVATGDTTEAGRINQVVYPDSWATDSSGLFFTDRFLQFVDRSRGTITEIAGLDPIRTVATGSFGR